MKTKFTGFRCPQDLLEKAKREAEEDHRSLSSFINKAIADALKRREQNDLKHAA